MGWTFLSGPWVGQNGLLVRHPHGVDISVGPMGWTERSTCASSPWGGHFCRTHGLDRTVYLCVIPMGWTFLSDPWVGQNGLLVRHPHGVDISVGPMGWTERSTCASSPWGGHIFPTHLWAGRTVCMSISHSITQSQSAILLKCNNFTKMYDAVAVKLNVRPYMR